MAQDTPVPLILMGRQYFDFTHNTDEMALADLMCVELNLPQRYDAEKNFHVRSEGSV